jgi:hypothetical protein
MIAGKFNRIEPPHKVSPAETKIADLFIVVVLLGQAVLN